MRGLLLICPEEFFYCVGTCVLRVSGTEGEFEKEESGDRGYECVEQEEMRENRYEVGSALGTLVSA